MILTTALSSRRLPALSIGLAAILSAFGPGCAEMPEDLTAVDPDELLSDNGLKTINGMKVHNGLASGSGLNLDSSLKSPTGLNSGSGLMSSADGRTTVTYLVRCALPAGRSITKTDQNGKPYTFKGQIGVAPGWETGACTGTCERWVSACMLALVNTTGDHYPLWMVAENPAIGWGLDPAFPFQEGSFFGDIFTSPPSAYYCGGPDFRINPIPGRIGTAQVMPPYTNAAGTGGKCLPACTPADYPHQTEGVKACYGWNEVITVFHQ
ncbi:MAG TPA: hypothetical protein VFH68_05070 [Polyangia bacterium]|nr:hypothetical protein [Polyangia bacterium]